MTNPNSKIEEEDNKIESPFLMKCSKCKNTSFRLWIDKKGYLCSECLIKNQ